jgi:DNA repair exonuclease SbcCD nuclease subunit
MEKAFVFSDLHVHQYRQFNEDGRRLKNGIAFLDYIFKLANANSIRILLMPGDLFNNMQIMATKAVNAVATSLQHSFAIYPEITLIAISGNHDDAEVNLIDKPAESALEYLATVFPRFVLLDKCDQTFITEGGNIIWGAQYYEHSEHFRMRMEEIIHKFEARKGKSFLLMHQSVASGLPIDDDIEPTDPLFDRFHMIFNGHIHDNQLVTDKFVNVGSPMHRDGGDVGKTKGFWVVDLDDPLDTISFVDITNRYPTFIHKFVGEELTEDEAKQYVIRVQNPTLENIKNKEVTEKFNTSLAPAKIMENYCSEVLPKDDSEKYLKYGISLLK